MASPESSEMSSEQWPVKPLHGRASGKLRQNDRQIIGDQRRIGHSLGAEARGWTDFRGSLDEGESQKAGAKQGDPTCSQGKEAIGNKISISHDTFSDSDARPN